MKNLIKKSIFCLGATLALSACSTGNLASNAPTCGSMDWFEKGRQDGASGIESKSEGLEEYCGASFAPDSKLLYSNGYNAGLVEFCSPTNAFKLGQMGTPFTNRCPELMKPDFMAAFRKGEESRKLKMQNEALAQKIQALSQKVHTRNVASEDAQDPVNAQLEQLKKLYAQNEKKLSQIRN